MSHMEETYRQTVKARRRLGIAVDHMNAVGPWSTPSNWTQGLERALAHVDGVLQGMERERKRWLAAGDRGQ